MVHHRPTKTGCLLINLGTPDEPTPRAVRRYLREFLSDPRVLDLPLIGRWSLLNLVILPTRPAKSALAYRSIWSAEGSPLLRYSQDLASGVQERLGPEVPVELGMRYGSPSLANALNRLRDQGCERIVILPLYPQYASSSTGSSLEEVYRIVQTWWNVPSLHVVAPFYGHPGFIASWGEVIRPVLDEMGPDHVLFSFHGLPERQVKKSDETRTHCLAQEGCCDRLTSANRHCYRAQSYATARAIAQELDLPSDRYSVSFQSRLGRTPWIRPYTDHVLPELLQGGAKRVAVVCPAFTADCLETLEEIGLRARAAFLAQGGEDLRLVPSLNAHPAWIGTVTGLLTPHLMRQTEPDPLSRQA